MHSQIECRIFPPIFDAIYRFYAEFWDLFACREAAGKFYIFKKSYFRLTRRRKMKKTPKIFCEKFIEKYMKKTEFSVLSV